MSKPYLIFRKSGRNKNNRSRRWLINLFTSHNLLNRKIYFDDEEQRLNFLVKLFSKENIVGDKYIKRAITMWLKENLLSVDEIKKLYTKLGYGQKNVKMQLNKRLINKIIRSHEILNEYRMIVEEINSTLLNIAGKELKDNKIQIHKEHGTLNLPDNKIYIIKVYSPAHGTYHNITVSADGRIEIIRE